MGSQTTYTASAISSARPSFETTKTGTTTSTTSLLSSDPIASTGKAKKAWAAIKKHAKEHHRSVNAAYAAYYGAGQMRPQVQPMKGPQGTRESAGGRFA